MFILWSVSFFVIAQRTRAQGQVSGNAMDLANMNMNMMNTKCPLEPCQSVCLVKQPDTGCFVCNPKCNPGTNIGMPDSGLPMNIQPINSGQAGFYSGCENDNWMQCPLSCVRKFDHKGCFQCQCQATNNIQATTKQASMMTVTTKTSVSTTVPRTARTSITATSVVDQTTSTTKPPTPTLTKHATLKNSTTKTISLVISTLKAPVPSRITTEYLKTQFHDSLKQNEQLLHRNTSGIFIDTDKDPLRANSIPAETDDFKPNYLTFILFGIMIVLTTLCFVFLIAWRKSSLKLKKNKDELYFVHKAYRQDSRAHLSQNDMADPVYADIGPRPEPPPRSPPNVRSSVETVGPARSLSHSSETPLKEHSDDFKHDYLELI